MYVSEMQEGEEHKIIQDREMQGERQYNQCV